MPQPQSAEPDPFNLQRFVDAQAAVFDGVRHELATGRKRSHWMWFIFPQIAGLGHSAMAQRYAIQNLAEAEAYLAHPILGPRLRECSELVLAIDHRTAYEIFGSPDDVKLRSSMTLFAQASSPDSVFKHVLDKYYGGSQDSETLQRLR